MTTYVISAYHHWSWKFEKSSWHDVLDTTLCDKGCQWLGTGQWFSLDTPVFSDNKTDRHDIAEILFKVALNTIIENQTSTKSSKGDNQMSYNSIIALERVFCYLPLSNTGRWCYYCYF
jgi:tRNA U34 5-methylaminomethyl-2-thiouridine-forming methyltransferase MnmC